MWKEGGLLTVGVFSWRADACLIFRVSHVVGSGGKTTYDRVKKKNRKSLAAHLNGGSSCGDKKRKGYAEG